jgi:flagellin
MGAVISRLQFAADNLFNVSAKASESRSRIEDTDYSMATTDLARRNIIQQAAQAMLAQANQAPQLVLQLLK